MNEETFDRIESLSRRRRFLLKMRNQIDRQIEGFVRCYGFGYSTFAPEKERKAAMKQSDAWLKALGNGEVEALEHPLAGIVTLSEMAREPFSDEVKKLDKSLEKEGKALPIFEAWAKDVRGLGPKSLAMIIGETGNLSNYGSVKAVWKRLGLSVMDDGSRQRKFSDKEKAERAGYNPQRRSVSWQMFDSMFKNCNGKYRAMYDDYKAKYLEKEMTKGHADRAARRKVEKEVIRDLTYKWWDIHGKRKPDYAQAA